jgi:glycosyltransferase involved in cell wall biosynthesis
MLTGIGHQPIWINVGKHKTLMFSVNDPRLLPALMVREECECIVLCGDIHRIPPQIMRQAKAQNIPIYAWSPVHHDIETVPIQDGFKSVQKAAVYSQWGQACLAEMSIESEYIPCPVDLEIFTPKNRDICRKNLAIDSDVFLVSMVGINREFDSKGFSEALQGFALFAQHLPEARLYLHTNIEGGLDLMRLAEDLGIKDKLIWPNRLEFELYALKDEYMADVYNASDVYLSTSRWEGFGLPIAEAQACGCPVIGPASSAVKEIIWNGLTVSGQRLWRGAWVNIADTEVINQSLRAISCGEIERHQPYEVLSLAPGMIAKRLENFLNNY